MINAQFDLQNIINEMKTVDRASNSSSNSEKGQFSETLDRISKSESPKRRSTSTHQPYEKAEQRPSEKPISDSRDEADSSEPEDGPETATTQSVVSQSSGSISGNILPLLPPGQPLMNQVMLESKRPILVGDLKATGDINDQIHKLAESDGLAPDTKIGSKIGFEMEGANLNFQSLQNKEAVELRVLPSKSSKLMNAENPDVDTKDNSALNSIHRSAEPRNLDLAPGSKSSMPTSPQAFDTEAFKEGLSKIIKNQIVSSFSGKNVTLKMVLTPESLGEIEVDLHFTKDKSLQVTLRPETLEIAKLIQTNAASLREQLSQEHKGFLSLNMTDHFTGEDNRNGSNSNRSDENAKNGLVGSGKQNFVDSDSSEFARAKGDETSSLVDTFV